MAETRSRLERLLQTLADRHMPPKLSTIPAVTDDPVPTEPQQVAETHITPVPAYSIAHSPPDPHQGEPAPLGVGFTPFLAVTKFPYKFIDKRHMQAVASAFFDQGKIWDREWDIYYVLSPFSPTPNAVTFVPDHQLVSLLKEINEALPEVKASINDDLIINFDEFRNHSDLRPRFLGHSTSRAQYASWTDNLTMTPKGIFTPDDPSARTLKAFQQSMEHAIELGKNKSKAAKTKRQSENVVKRQGMTQSFMRTQRYLGLHPSEGESLLPDIGNLSLKSMDPTIPCRHPFETDVIFIAFDVEAWEHPPRFVTEIGVATLDTRDLHKAAPGRAGEEWQRFIRARHFLIDEYKQYKNKEFVRGCPEKFEFGKSEYISKDDIGRVVSKCFKQPFSSTTSTTSNEKRNVVLLGHDIGQDIAYLQKCGFNVLNSGSVVDTCDSADLYRAYTKDPQQPSLGSIIYDHGLTAWNLHNAGNDAVYTVWAMLATCVTAAAERGSPEAAQKQEDRRKERMQALVEQAKQRAAEDLEGW